ncbi:MAG TPA: helix-turn-helix domain-containing protein [Longimicrobium sp.]|nr:helix-turn-helix domain-containing protein [Longimicrobium sp.]
MKIATRPILVMHGNGELRTAIRSLTGREYTFLEVPDWDALAGAIHEAPPSALVVVDPFAAPSGGSTTTLRTLVEEFPSVPVLAAVAVTPDCGEDLVAVVQAGAVDIIVIGHDDTREALRERFRMAHSRPLKVLLDHLLPADMPGRSRAIVESAADVVAIGGYGRDLSTALRLGRRTLLRWTERSALPPPRQLLAWLRILVAAQLLDDPGRTVLSVAMACGYSSDTGLRRVMQRFLGETPRSLRRRGRAFDAAGAAFLSRLEHLRERRKVAG